MSNPVCRVKRMERNWNISIRKKRRFETSSDGWESTDSRFSGREHEVDVTDRRIARIISKLQDLPGQSLFQYTDDEGNVRDVSSQDVNEYLREITGEDFTAKDFRTWAGTVLAAVALGTMAASETKKQAKANMKHAISAVAEILGNNPAVCRRCYIHPAVLEAYLNGNSVSCFKPRSLEVEKRGIDFASTEAAVLKLLQAGSSKSDA